MKILAPAAAEPGLALISTLEAAARDFNRTLDIRLRFLDIGVDLVPVRPLHGQPTAGAEAWTLRLGRVVAREVPRLIVVRAGDPAALPAALEGAGRGIPVVVFGDAPGAVDELRERCPAARVHALGDLADPEEGRRLIEILVAERAAS